MIRRRLYIDERMSKLAVWSLRLAVFAIPVTLLGVVLQLTETLDIYSGFITMLAGFGIAALALLVAIAAFAVIWSEGLKGLGRVAGAGILALLLLGPPAAVVALGARLPAIHDITTDTDDPPDFHVLAFARPRAANPLAYAGEEAAQAQREAYPQVKSVDLDATPDEAYNSLMALVTRRKWQLVDATPPRGGLREGRIEAVARSLLLGLREDVVIRVRPTLEGARVDIRSASRYAPRDFGSNASRIDGLLADLADERGRRRR